MLFNLRTQLSLLMLVTIIAVAGTTNSRSLFGQQTSKSYKPVVGEPHPDFSFPKISDGKAVTLSDYRGKKVLLLHFASW